jgi:hypothetical protein
MIFFNFRLKDSKINLAMKASLSVSAGEKTKHRRAAKNVRIITAGAQRLRDFHPFLFNVVGLIIKLECLRIKIYLKTFVNKIFRNFAANKISLETSRPTFISEIKNRSQKYNEISRRFLTEQFQRASDFSAKF